MARQGLSRKWGTEISGFFQDSGVKRYPRTVVHCILLGFMVIAHLLAYTWQ
jgi:hypothetical protein